MIAATALRLAGPGHALMGARLRPVAHVGEFYQGVVYAPICGTWIDNPDRVRLMPLDLHPEARRLCRRCTSLLSRRRQGQGRRATTRDEVRAAHQGTSLEDLAFALELAQTPEEVDAVAHLTLVIAGNGAVAPAAPPVPGWSRNLGALVARHRRRVGGFAATDEERALYRDLAEAAAIQTRRADAHAQRVERENRNLTRSTA